MKPMKTIRLAEIFKLPIHLLKLFMMDFYSLGWRKVHVLYKARANATRRLPSASHTSDETKQKEKKNYFPVPSNINSLSPRVP